MGILLVGYKAADLNREILDGEVTCHVLDIYHQHAIEKVFPGTKVVCTPHLPKGDWQVVKFRTGPKLMSGELALDLLQEAHGLGCPVEVDFIGRERDRNDLINKIKNDPKRVRSFRSEWPASVPGGEKLMFTSYPGCFCHRRLDEGGLALAEVVSRELDGKGEGLKILDMGCGCGLVGLLIARPGMELTMIDSHARAVEAATENAAKFGVKADVRLADNGIDDCSREWGSYDIFVGNPPYYSDYRIAEVFLNAAKKALKRGGVCYTVVKTATGLKPVQEKFFAEVQVLPRRGYSILKSVMV